MIPVTLDIKQFEADMSNILDYSNGFLEGVAKGTPNFLNGLGKTTIESLKEFIDSNARVEPGALHHVYEWYLVGSPEARLFDISFAAKSSTIEIFSKFSQSKSFQDGSFVPFYDKARIMEYGMSVTVKPRGQNPLVFQDGGETVFTKTPVTIDSPGGRYVEGAYRNVFDLFFSKYFSQSFLTSSGIIDYVKNPRAFKDHLSAGKKGGRSVGVSTGYNWISKAGEL